LQGKVQESRGRRKKEEKNEMVAEVKLELYFLHTPLLHGWDTKMNLMMPWNDIFGCQNQPYMSSVDNRVVDACPTRANVFFFKFLLIY